jgi:hypothetical protein
VRAQCSEKFFGIAFVVRRAHHERVNTVFTLRVGSNRSERRVIRFTVSSARSIF